MALPTVAVLKPVSINKMDISRDGSTMVAAGLQSGLAIFTRLDLTQPEIVVHSLEGRQRSPGARLSNVRITDDGDIYAQMSKSNDMVCFNPDMQEKSRIKGERELSVRSDTPRYFNNPHAHQSMLFSKGDSTLYLLELLNAEVKEVPNFFWPSSKEPGIPLIACCFKRGETIVGLTAIPGGGTLLCLKEPDEPTKHHGTEIKMSTMGTVSTLEFCIDGKFIIAGGSTSSTNQVDGLICAFSLGNKLKQSAMQLFQNYRCVSRIVRVPNMNKFIAATTNFIFVVEFVNEIKFNTIGTIRNINNNSRL